jgi:hypothetical protein
MTAQNFGGKLPRPITKKGSVMRRALILFAVMLITPQPSGAQQTIKAEDGTTLMEEVLPAAPKHPAKDADTQSKVQQAYRNESEYLKRAQAEKLVPLSVDGTAGGAAPNAPGAIVVPAYIPFSTVNPPYSVSGETVTPFNIRDYSYGGTTQSFGAPMFVGGEMPNPYTQYQPLGGAPRVLGAPMTPLPLQMAPQQPVPGTTGTLPLQPE